jgi:glycosyltransferase involved in cell wall biosynthesis
MNAVAARKNLRACTSDLKVLVIAQYFPPDIGGAATRAYNAAKGLILNGCKVTIVTAFPHYPHGKIPKEYRWKPVKIEWIGKIKVVRTFILPLESRGLARRILLFESFAISSLFALLLIRKVDVIWAANPDILSMMPAMIYSKVKRRPIVSNVDDLVLKDLYDLNLMEESSVMLKLAELAARISYLKAKAVTPVSPGYVEYLSKRYGVEKSKIHVVRGGVDLTIFNSRAFQQNTRRKFTVLYSGAFSVAYDFEQILKAAKIVEEKDNRVEFILQGKGELASSIKSKIKELNLKNVRVVDKVFSRDEVAELLNQADMLILPLRDFGKPYLGMSSKLYEYQAVGKPIICCAEGQPADYVKETNSGIVIKPGDHETLAEAVMYLKRNPDIAQMMSENGKKYVENKLSIEVIGLKMKKLFKTLTQKD